MPISIVTESVPISSSVVAAFLLFGFLNAGTPLLIASTPVRAAQPDENVRRIRNAPERTAQAVDEGLVGGDRELRAVDVRQVAEDRPAQPPGDHADDRRP